MRIVSDVIAVQYVCCQSFITCIIDAGTSLHDLLAWEFEICAYLRFTEHHYKPKLDA